MDQKENKKEAQKEYYLKNRDKLLKYFKEYKAQHKEKISAYAKTYYQGHKQKYREMVHCAACDRAYDYSNLPKHKNTKKHIDNLNK
jgi:hypothetical protein